MQVKYENKIGKTVIVESFCVKEFKSGIFQSNTDILIEMDIKRYIGIVKEII